MNSKSKGTEMDIRVQLTLVLIVVLLLFWWVDLMIDDLQMRRGPRPSWLCAIVFFGCMVVGPSAEVMKWITSGVCSLFIFFVAYWATIRKRGR